MWSAAILFTTSTPINRERRLQGLEHHNSPASTLYLPSYGASLLISILNYGPAEIGVVITVFFLYGFVHLSSYTVKLGNLGEGSQHQKCCCINFRNLNTIACIDPKHLLNAGTIARLTRIHGFVAL